MVTFPLYEPAICRNDGPKVRESGASADDATV